MPPNDPINTAITPPQGVSGSLITQDQGQTIQGIDITLPFVDDPTGQYMTVGLASTYGWDMGLAGAPVAAAKTDPPAQAVVWRVHGGFCVRIAEWLLKRIGDVAPPPPHWQTSDNEVLFSKAINFSGPELLPDGKAAWTCLGRYVWLCLQMPDDTTPLLVPSSRLLVGGTPTFVNPSLFVRTELGPVPPPPGFQGGINF